MSMPSECTINARRPDGSVDVAVLAGILHVTEAELGATVGLSGDSSAGQSWQDSPEGQSRLSGLVDLLERVTPWAGDPRAAYAWYCSQPIAGFGGMTAQDLVKAGRTSAVETYLDRIAAGGYA